MNKTKPSKSSHSKSQTKAIKINGVAGWLLYYSPHIANHCCQNKFSFRNTVTKKAVDDDDHNDNDDNCDDNDNDDNDNDDNCDDNDDNLAG